MTERKNIAPNIGEAEAKKETNTEISPLTRAYMHVLYKVESRIANAGGIETPKKLGILQTVSDFLYDELRDEGRAREANVIIHVAHKFNRTKKQL